MVVAVLTGDKTLTELAEHFGVNPTQITDWKQHFLVRVSDVFVGTKLKPDELDFKRLHTKVGQLMLEYDCRIAALAKARWLSATR